MTLRKPVLMVCFLAGCVISLYSQGNAQPKGQAGAHARVGPCPEDSYCVDLCALAPLLDSADAPKMAPLEVPRNHLVPLPIHDEIRLYIRTETDKGRNKDKKDQIIWTCGQNKGFQITQIRRVWDGCSPEMPFSQTLYDTELRKPQGPWARLASGPVRPGSSGTYKFSFIIAGDAPLNPVPGDPTEIIKKGTRYDPHIIVSGPDTGNGRQMRCAGPTPAPTPNKNQKPGSQEGLAGGSAKR